LVSPKQVGENVAGKHLSQRDREGYGIAGAQERNKEKHTNRDWPGERSKGWSRQRNTDNERSKIQTTTKKEGNGNTKRPARLAVSTGINPGASEQATSDRSKSKSS
jgi:hypothetical protein